MILCHFIFEYVHHYYDGNGRLGRYLFPSDLYLETHNIFSFSTSSSLEHEKERYYSALKKASDRNEFGYSNNYVERIINILINQINLIIKKISDCENIITSLNIPTELTKSQNKIFNLISEA